jgi:hypothetical protein
VQAQPPSPNGIIKTKRLWRSFKASAERLKNFSNTKVIHQGENKIIVLKSLNIMPTPLKITLSPELEQQMLYSAQKQNITIESLVLPD